MARGTDEKKILFDKIREVYPNAFWETQDKILRVPINDVEIKVTLTCAKDNIGGGFQSSSTSNGMINFEETAEAAPSTRLTEPTEREIENVKRLMEQLNL